jgi:general secretion pathway protein G
MRAQGFTLIEMLVTVVIVALLASIAMPMTELVVQRAREQALHTDLHELRSGIDAYKRKWDEGHIQPSLEDSGYPKSLNVLVDGVEDFKSPKRSKMYFLRRIPRDPFNPDTSIPAADSWGKRSYKSPPDEPQEGDDVYDVYTHSTGIGLNGVPYREW